MGVRFACHACGKRLNIKTELAGKRGICPACSVRFRIPPYNTDLSTPLESTPIEAEESMSVSAQASEARITNAKVANSTGSSESVASQDSGGVALQDSPQTQELASSVTERAAPPSARANLQDVLGDTTATWYVRPPNGGQYGPADGPTMGQWMKEGRVADLAMVWRDGWTDWRVAKDAIPGVVPTVSDHSVQDRAEPSASSGHLEGIDRAAREGDTEEGAASQPPDLELTPRSGPLGSNKQKRSRKRVVTSITLGLVFFCLISALVFVLTRS